MRKLFKVEIERTVMVMAEDEKEAERLALYYEREEEAENTFLSVVKDLSEVTDDWKESIPYGSEDDQTCEQLLKGQ